MITLDNSMRTYQNELATFNSVASFERLKHKGRQPAYFGAIISSLSGIFTSVKPLLYPFQWWAWVWVALRLPVLCAGLSNQTFCLPPKRLKA